MLPASCSKSDEEYLEYLFCTEKRFLGWAAKLVDVWANVSESPRSPATDYSEDCCVLGKVILFPCEKRTYGISRGPFAFTNAFEALPQAHDFLLLEQYRQAACRFGCRLGCKGTNLE